MKRARQRRDDGPHLFEPTEVRAQVGPFDADVVAGIDEAGLGPLLGPLCIGCSAFRVAQTTHDLWTKLAPLVGRAAGHQPELIAVDDSKLVFTRTPVSARRLERAVLAFHAQLHGLPRDAREFFGATSAALRCPELERECWYADLPERLADDADDLAPLAAALEAALAAVAITPLLLAVRAVPPSALNASFERTASKGTSAFEETARWIELLWREHARAGLDLAIDRQGGRMRYAAVLEAALPDAKVTVVSEIAARSEYRLHAPDGRRARVVFAERAESFSFPVALASCFAKYARELAMKAFNAHFTGFDATLVPTAGYVTDARRWLTDAEVAIRRAEVPLRHLVRER